MKSKNIKAMLAVLLSVSLVCLAGCGADNKKVSDNEQTPQNTSAQDVDKSDSVGVRIVLEDGRTLEGKLYPHVAPKSCENFIKLAESKFYDGLIFHRCINGFMIQAGGYDKSFYEGNFNQKEAEPIKGEFSANGVENNLKHTKGILSMARRTNDPDSGSSQFFIMQADTASLDGQYAAFGEITEGLDVVDEIAGAETMSQDGQITYQGQTYPQTMDDVPKTPVVIKTIEIIK